VYVITTKAMEGRAMLAYQFDNGAFLVQGDGGMPMLIPMQDATIVRVLLPDYVQAGWLQFCADQDAAAPPPEQEHSHE